MKKQIKHYTGGREGIYDPRYDAYEGGTLPGITVTGNAPKKGLYPVRLRFNPNKWSTARTKLLLPSEMMAPLSLAAEAINEVPVIGPAFNQYVAPALSVGNWIVGGGNPYEGMELRANDERLLGGWLPLDFAGPKIIGSAVSKAARETINSAGIKAIRSNAKMTNDQQPGIFYHGSPHRGLENLNPGKMGAIFFTDDKLAARGYTGVFGTGEVYPVKLDLGLKPMRIDASGHHIAAIPDLIIADGFGIPKENINNYIRPHHTFKASPGRPEMAFYSGDDVVSLGKQLGATSVLIGGALDSGKGIFGMFRDRPYNLTAVFSPELVRMNPKINTPVEPRNITRNIINDSLTTTNVSHATNPRQYVSPQSSLWMDAQTLEPIMTTDWSARDLFRQDRINSLYTPEEIASNRRFFERMSDETTIPKGFVEGNELAMPTLAMVPVEETGLSVRNANPINLENPVMNPAERQAALDFLKENPQMRGQIETKVRPGVAEEDWRYPHETMVEHGLRKPTVTTNKYTKAKKLQQEDLTKDLSRSYGPSQQIGFSENWDFSMDRTRFERLQKAKREVTENVELEPPKPVKPPRVEPPKKTSQQRSKEYYREKVEDKELGVFKRLRRLFNQAHALEDGDMRHVNSGRPNSRQITNAELNIEKYPLHEQKNYEKLRKRLARRGYTTEEISRSPEMKDLLEDLIRRYGNY